MYIVHKRKTVAWNKKETAWKVWWGFRVPSPCIFQSPRVFLRPSFYSTPWDGLGEWKQQTHLRMLGNQSTSLVLFNDNDGTGGGDNEVGNGYFFNTADPMSLNLLSYLQFSLELTYILQYLHLLSTVSILWLSSFEPRDLNWFRILWLLPALSQKPNLAHSKDSVSTGRMDAQMSGCSFSFRESHCNLNAMEKYAM